MFSAPLLDTAPLPRGQYMPAGGVRSGRSERQSGNGWWRGGELSESGNAVALLVRSRRDRTGSRDRLRVLLPRSFVAKQNGKKNSERRTRTQIK